MTSSDLKTVVASVLGVAALVVATHRPAPTGAGPVTPPPAPFVAPYVGDHVPNLGVVAPAIAWGLPAEWAGKCIAIGPDAVCDNPIPLHVEKG